MNVIYSFKKLNHPHHKPIDDRFFTMANLSVEMAKKYHTTIFYGDQHSHNMFKRMGIVFDKSVVLDTINDYEGDITSYAKIMAMMEQTEPYACLDFDTLLFEKISTNSTITYGYPEVSDLKVYNILKNKDSSEYIEYIKTFYKNHLEKYRNRFPKYVDSNLNYIPNYSLFIVNNPYLIREIIKHILNSFNIDELEEVGAMYLEQYLISAYLQGIGADVSFLYNDTETKITDILRTIKYKFHHYIDYYLDNDFDKKVDMIADIFEIDMSVTENII